MGQRGSRNSKAARDTGGRDRAKPAKGRGQRALFLAGGKGAPSVMANGRRVVVPVNGTRDGVRFI